MNRILLSTLAMIALIGCVTRNSGILQPATFTAQFETAMRTIVSEFANTRHDMNAMHELDTEVWQELPDTILVNGHIFTGTQARPYVDAIAIKGARILAVGTNQEISSTAGVKTRRIDLAGHLVIPGINDAHVHFAADPIGTRLVFGGLAPTCTHVLDVLEQAARKLPTGTLISGAIGAEAFFDPACTPAALDRVAPGDAVVLDTLSAHAGILNLAAAKKFGARTNDPPPLAGWYGKDMKSRQWDGVVHQAAWARISEMLMSDRSHEDAKLRAFLEGEIKWGVTSITLMESYPAHRVEQLAVIDSPLRVRIVPFLTYQEVDRRRKPEYPEVPTQLMERVTVNGEKWMLDSNPFERSGGMRQPYADDPTRSGQVDFSPVEIRAILEESLQHDRPLLLHAVGDRTTETLLNQMEATGGAKTWSQRRLRIEHGDGLMPDLMPRAKNLGVIVVENPTHFAFGELYVRRYGPERAAVMLPLRSLMDAGMPLVIATDGVVGIPVLNPYLSLMFASAYPGKPKESLTREQAVTAFTATAAYAEFAESSKGTLEPGKFADLAVLSQNIFRAPLQDLPKTESILTIVGGKIAFTSGLLTAK